MPSPKESGIARSDIRVSELCEDGSPVGAEEGHSVPSPKESGIARSDIRVSELCEDGSPVGAEEGHSVPSPKESGIARSDIRVPEAKRGRVPCRNEGDAAFRLTRRDNSPCAGRKIVYNTAARRAVCSA